MNAEIKPKKHFSMIRGFHLADAFTLGNAACGVGTVFLAMAFLRSGSLAHYLLAAALAPAALAFDVLDGRVARWRQTHSALGRELDSLADVISFGVAPAVLGFTLGLRGGWDMLILTYFVVCGVSRLARFNVTADALADATTGKVKYFEGTPIPTSIAIVLLLGLAFYLGRTDEQLWFGALRLGPATLHPLSLLYGLSGSAMISATLRIPKP